MYCPSCSTHSTDGAKFCKACGTGTDLDKKKARIMAEENGWKKPLLIAAALVLIFAAWSLFTLKRKDSVRLAAVSLFTCFLVGFTLLTYFATVHRGPNWHFYWWPSQWPVH